MYFDLPASRSLRNQTSQIDIPLTVACQHIERPTAQQTEVGMIEHTLHAHRGLQLIESLCRHALQEGIGLARHLHTIDHIVALLKVAHHLGDALQIVLKIGIDGHDSISPLTGCHHTSHDGILMADIAGEVDATHILALAMQLGDNLPGTVMTAVIDEDHHGVAADKSFGDHALKEGCQPLDGVAQHFLFIITGGNGC